MESLNTTITTILESIWPFVLTGALLVVFGSVLAIGFELIVHRKDDEKRKESLQSLIYVAIGAVVIVGALFITNTILGVANDFTDTLESQTVSQ